MVAPTQKRIVEVGIAGTGWRAGSHARAVKTINDMTDRPFKFAIRGLFDPKPGAAQGFAHEHDICQPKLFVNNPKQGYMQMLNSCNLDAVIITSVNSAHEGQAWQALHRSKHVYCDKPMASTMQNLDLLLQLAHEQSDLVTQTGLCLRYDPFVQMFIKLVKNGEFKLGDLLRIANVYSHRVNITDKEWKIGPEMVNAFAMGGCHALDFQLLIMSALGFRPVSVVGTAQPSIDGTFQIHPNVTGTITYRDEEGRTVTGTMIVSVEAGSGYNFNGELNGTEGSLEFRSMHSTDLQVILTGKSAEGANEFEFVPSSRVGGPVPGSGDVSDHPTVSELLAFGNAIMGQPEESGLLIPRPSFSAASMTEIVSLAIIEAAETGRAVEIKQWAPNPHMPLI